LRVGRKTCDVCYEHLKIYNQKRCRDVKKRAVAHFGGACNRCGFSTQYLSVYDFHHVDPSKKEFGFATLLKKGWSWDIMLVELGKCIMLCANCHRIEHYENK
jgi:predicted HNH restriction endonuclease